MSIGLIDFVLVGVIALVTWCVAAEGAFGAGTILLSVIISGLLAMNFFEPLAGVLENIAMIGPKADMIALLGLFAVFLTVMRVICEKLSPTYIGLHRLAHDIGSWGFGALTGYVTAAILLTAVHTSPLPLPFLGFKPARNNLFNIVAPDRQWLGFTQYITERSFSQTRIVRDPLVGDVPVKHIFDGRTAYRWNLHKRGAARVLRKADVTRPTPENQREITIAATQIVMPSFIIRYADRRARLSGKAPATAEPAVKSAPMVEPTGPNF